MSSPVTISAADVNVLRKKTNAPMMDCKKALVEANGDFEKAVEILRKKGQKIAANRSDRAASEGVILAKTTPDGKTGIIMSLNCETDFVAKNEDFVKFADKIAQIAITTLPANVEELRNKPFEGGLTIADAVLDYVGKMGEKIEVSSYDKLNSDLVFAYNHTGNRVASIIAMNKNNDQVKDIAKDLAIQIVAMTPIALDKADIPQSTIDKELEIAKELIRAEGKPEEMVEKISQGKLNKFYNESTLLNQEFVKDNKKTVRQYLTEADKDLKVIAFKRHSLS